MSGETTRNDQGISTCPLVVVISTSRRVCSLSRDDLRVTPEQGDGYTQTWMRFIRNRSAILNLLSHGVQVPADIKGYGCSIVAYRPEPFKISINVSLITPALIKAVGPSQKCCEFLDQYPPSTEETMRWVFSGPSVENFPTKNSEVGYHLRVSSPFVNDLRSALSRLTTMYGGLVVVDFQPAPAPFSPRIPSSNPTTAPPDSGSSRTS